MGGSGKLANPPFGKKSSQTFTNEEGEQEKEDLTYNRQDFWATTSNLGAQEFALSSLRNVAPYYSQPKSRYTFRRSIGRRPF